LPASLPDDDGVWRDATSVISSRRSPLDTDGMSGSSELPRGRAVKAILWATAVLARVRACSRGLAELRDDAVSVEPLREIRGAQVGVSLKHGHGLVARYGRDFHAIEFALFEYSRRRLVPEVVKH